MTDRPVLSLPEPDLDQRTLSVNDPQFVAASDVFHRVRTEAAARRTAVAASIVRDLLPDGTFLTFDWSDKDTGLPKLISIRDASGRLLALDDRAHLADVPDDVPSLDHATTAAVSLMIDVAQSYDPTYFAKVGVEHPEWDLHEDDVFVADLGAALTQVAQTDQDTPPLADADRQGGEPAIVYVATHATKYHDWLGIGSTDRGARDALLSAWRAHNYEFGLNPSQFARDDINVVSGPIGSGFRDYDRLPATPADTTATG